MIDKSEILRYMRTNSKTTDEKILALVDEAIKKVEDVAEPKTLYRIFDCEVEENEVKIENCVFKSARFSKNVSGCKQIVVFGATLGIGVDRLIKSETTSNIAMAMAVQATSAAMIEEIIDKMEEEIKSQNGVTLRQRYSPGYFDLDISNQPQLFSLIEITKRIGVTLTSTLEMLPTKSVTGFIGID